MKDTKIAIILLVALAFAGTVTTPDNALGEGFLSAPWRFKVNLYGWLPDAPAEIRVDDKTVVDVPENVQTILDSLQRAAKFELEAHRPTARGTGAAAEDD